MQHANASQAHAFFALLTPARASQPGSARKADCGWYDSSFDLARGLEIVEQDDDALYQLWALARH